MVALGWNEEQLAVYCWMSGGGVFVAPWETETQTGCHRLWCSLETRCRLDQQHPERWQEEFECP